MRNISSGSTPIFIFILEHSRNDIKDPLPDQRSAHELLHRILWSKTSAK